MRKNPPKPSDENPPEWDRTLQSDSAADDSTAGESFASMKDRGVDDRGPAEDWHPADHNEEPTRLSPGAEAIERTMARLQGDRYVPGEPTGSAIAVIGPATARVVEMLEDDARTIVDATGQVMEDIFARIVSASTADDVLADDSTLDAVDVLGERLQLWDFRTYKSDFEGGLRWFVALKVVRLDTGDDAVITCGAQKVLAQCVKLKSLKALPVVVKFVRKERATQAGHHPYAMVKAG